MGVDGADAYLYFGVLLSEKEAMRHFGAKYKEISGIYDKCPEDNKPNPKKKKFCADCGTKLEWKKKEKIGEGVESLDEIDEYLPIIESSGLDVYSLDEDFYKKRGIILGKEVCHRDIFNGGAIDPIELSDIISNDVPASLKKLGVEVDKNKVKLYLVGSIDY
jgi:hypothetical protein